MIDEELKSIIASDIAIHVGVMVVQEQAGISQRTPTHIRLPSSRPVKEVWLDGECYEPRSDTAASKSPSQIAAELDELVEAATEAAHAIQEYLGPDSEGVGIERMEDAAEVLDELAARIKGATK